MVVDRGRWNLKVPSVCIPHHMYGAIRGLVSFYHKEFGDPFDDSPFEIILLKGTFHSCTVKVPQ
jgi:hypothetical protein